MVVGRVVELDRREQRLVGLGRRARGGTASAPTAATTRPSAGSRWSARRRRPCSRPCAARPRAARRAARRPRGAGCESPGRPMIRSASGRSTCARRSVTPASSIALTMLGQRRLALALDQRLQPVLEQQRAVGGGERVGVGAAEALGLLVVPRHEVLLVDHLRVLGERREPRGALDGVEAAPLELLLAPDREVVVEALRPQRVGARVEVGDLLRVGVEPVERVADVARGALEVARVCGSARGR